MSAQTATENSLAGNETDGLTPKQTDSALLGFWVFLMSDAVIFALLFATYGVMLPATAGGPTPGHEYKILPTLIETCVLLTSSFTYGMASVALKYGGSQRQHLGWMLLTLVLGVGFLGLEIHDFAGMFADGAYPTRSGYLSSFFALVPLHGLHVLFGVPLISVPKVPLLSLVNSRL
jgi:cytochrome o ubiquinol oxidase subunit 3